LRYKGDLNIATDQPSHRSGDDKNGHGRRDDASGAAAPELSETDPAGCTDLADEEGGDEEAGEDEEDINSEESSRQDITEEVVYHHGENCDTAQAIEPQDAADSARFKWMFCGLRFFFPSCLLRWSVSSG